MKKPLCNSGFSAIELLITLFIAAAFIVSGAQLYSAVIKDGGNVNAMAKASNTLTTYLQSYKTSATDPCVPSKPLTNSPITVAGLANVTISVEIICQNNNTNSSLVATGGIKTIEGLYIVHTFISSGTFTVTTPGTVEILVVGGGGGGGGGLGGGGGGGGVVWIPTVFKDNNSYSIIVGLGGLGSTYPATSSNGQDSTVFGAIAKGGGGSNPYSGGAGVAGGSGGGAGATDSTLGGGGATVGSSLGGNIGIIYGNRGGHMTTARISGPTRAAGGGGAGAQGLDTNCTIIGDTGQYGAGSGGVGIQNAILGTNYYWGGGGGGGNYVLGTGGYGGLGGGGGGGAQDGIHGPGGGQALNSGSIGGNPGGNGGANTGGGGGGSYWQPTTGGNGGSGVVIIRYITTFAKSLPKITATIKYGTPQKTLTDATYAKS